MISLASEETQENSRDNDMGDANNIPFIGMQTNIPVSPEVQLHFVTATILKADGYSSDKDVNFNNPIINEERLEVDEEELPKVGADVDAVEGQGTTTNVGTFVDIPSDVSKNEGYGAQG